MNHFELFDIPIDLFPDAQEIKKRFYILSKQHHPDINQATDPEAYVNSLEQTGLINAAYKTLTDLDSRLKYILEHFDVLVDPNEQLSPEFLMEMMDLNELMMEANTDANKKQQLLAEIENRESVLYDELSSLWNLFDANNPDMEILAQMKGVYFRRKYLLRIRKNLNSFAEL